MAKNQVVSALRLLLRPVIRMLLRNGVTWSEFAQAGKELFVQIAREDYGIQGRPTNSSRVALMTGLSRREVSRVKNALAGATEGLQSPQNRFSQILTAWHLDAKYLGPDGRPALLPVAGEGASLASLLREYVGDMPHGAVIKELEQRGLIASTAAGYRVLAREYIMSPADPDLLRQASQALHDHAVTVGFNVDAGRAGPARFERMAVHYAFAQERLPDFEAFLHGEGQAFLERIDGWLAANAAAGGDPARTLRVGVGAYLIRDEPRKRP